MTVVRAIPVEVFGSYFSACMKQMHPYARVYPSEVRPHSEVKPGAKGHFFKVHFDFFPDQHKEADTFYRDLRRGLKDLEWEHSGPKKQDGVCIDTYRFSWNRPSIYIRHDDPAVLSSLHAMLSSFKNEGAQPPDLIARILNSILDSKPK